MHRRFAFLTPPALLAALLGLALFPGAARAHRLVVECHLVKERTVQVEGWYSSPSKPHPAQQANVQVSRPDGSILTEGELDSRGFFTFTFDQPEVLTVVVSQTGHRQEVTLPMAFLQPNDAPVISSATDPRREQLKEVLIGVGFLLALAAFVLSVRNARALREMKKERRV